MKPGTKRALMRTLQAQGRRLHQDFTAIEGFSGELPRSVLRQLRSHPDVIALSTDAPVSSLQAAPPVGTLYTVTNTANSGAGSLRQAITDANARAGLDTIRFNIAGTGGHTITPSTALPTITSPVILDATTDDSFAANTNRPAIVLDGNNLSADGLKLSSTADGSTIKGLVIRDFAGDGIEIQSGSNSSVVVGNYIGRLTPTGVDAGAGEENSGHGVLVLGSANQIGGGNIISGNGNAGVSLLGTAATGNLVVGNYVGTNLSGTAAIANAVTGVEVLAGASSNIIGGPNARNVISGNASYGVIVTGSTTANNVIQGNYVGLNAAGAAALSNGSFGVVLDYGAPGTLVGTNLDGANDALEGNVISGNTGTAGSVAGGGIYLWASNTAIRGNIIGLNAAGTSTIPNGRAVAQSGGIVDTGASTNVTIGGTAPYAGNVIAGNIGDGLSLKYGPTTVLGNSIWGNTQEGIDLGSNGVTVNDFGDSDSGGANNGQNFPVLTQAVTTGNLVEITGTLNSTANSYFRVEFFGNAAADSTGYGEGQTYLGAVNVATNPNGTATFSTTLSTPVGVGAVISATATKSTSTFASFTDTSEFAQNVTATLAPYTLRNTLGLDAPTNTTATTVRTGTGVTVAVIDSGLLLDGGASTRIKTTRDFTAGNANPPAIAPLDAHGHGTHIAGLIGANQAEIKGVAPNVSYVSLRVLDQLGVGSTSNVIKAIEWAIANKATYGIDIINLSLGHPIYEPAATDPLVQAVESAVRNGIVVVAAAGNVGMNPLTGQAGYAGITSPGNAPSAITVGALKTQDTTRRSDDLVADYSSRGPTWYDAFAKPDIIAPGHRLVAAASSTQTLYTLFPTLRQTIGGRPYIRLSGTSMAAGVVSGTVAVMLEEAKTRFGAKPSANTVKAMLQTTAFEMSSASGAPYDVLTQGAGALNPLGALTLAGAINPALPVNTNWLTQGVTESTVVDGQTLAWANHIVWDDNIVWGTEIYAHHVAWEDNVVWGTSADDNVVWGTNASDNVVWGTTIDDNIVWGTNVVWGANVVWGTNVVWGSSLDDNIVWGTCSDDNVVWGTAQAVLTSAN